MGDCKDKIKINSTKMLCSSPDQVKPKTIKLVLLLPR